MAHSALHFSLGMVLGSVATLPAVVRAWLHRARLNRAIGRWLLVSYAVGFYAIVPSLLGWLGVPDAICRGPWMNIFILHPLLTRLRGGGLILAGFALVFCFVLPYTVLLAALARARRKHPRP